MQPMATYSIKSGDVKGSVIFKKKGYTVNLCDKKLNINLKEHSLDDAEELVYDFVIGSTSNSQQTT
jgi:hypothetical protein